MPWFNYIYPGAVDDPNSYQHVTSKPSCDGNTLCGIYAEGTGTIPPKPILTEELNNAIGQALLGVATENVTVLRPTP